MSNDHVQFLLYIFMVEVIKMVKLALLTTFVSRKSLESQERKTLMYFRRIISSLHPPKRRSL